MPLTESITTRIDNVTLIDDKYRGTVLPPPKSVKVEITARCNYRCQFCVKSMREDDGEMDRKLFSRIIREIHDAGVPEIGLFYIGESFTCKWLPDAIAECKEVGFDYVFLTTNGAAALPNIVEKCMAAGLDSLKFSLNFYDDEQLKSIAKVDGLNFRRAISNLKAARRIRDEGDYQCNIYASSIAFDGDQGRKMQAVIDEISGFVDQHYMLPLYGMDGASKEHGWKPSAGNPGRLENLREPLPCWAVFTEGHVTHDGLLAACCFGAGLNGEFIMADLKEVSFLNGWNSKKFQVLRESHLRKEVAGTPCETCVAGG